MSNHPYGLRGDPFASPATLSAKDASRLIRRRVRAFDGDGGVLYPINTCDLIHEIAGGIPDAMLELAGSALRIAAAEGAPAVSPAHVRKVAKSAPVADAAPVAETVPFHAVAGNTARVAACAEVPDAAIAAWEDDSDLPPFQPGAFTLPAQPSEELDPDARDWVSRFIPTMGAGPFAGARAADAPTLHVMKSAGASARASAPVAPPSTPAASAAESDRAFAAVYGIPARRRGSRPRSHRRRRNSGSQGFLITVAAVCVIALVVRMSMRGDLVPPGTERPVATSAPAVERRAYVAEPSPASADPIVSEPEPTHVPAGAATVIEEPTLRPPAPGPTAPVPAPASGTAPASVEVAPRQAPAAKFGLEVATFIFEERARVERDRLAAAGLRARVVTTLEYGSRVYRVVIGGYPHPAAAERAADSLLSNGVVLQARVVRATSGR